MYVVHLVDVDSSFRTATGQLLRSHGYETAEYDSAERLFERLRAGEEAGCILLDLNTPGFDAADLQGHLAKIGTSLPIVLLTGQEDTRITVRAIKAGAEDVLAKPIPGDALLESVDRAMDRYRVDHVHQEALRRRKTLLETLTPREREVFDFVVRGRMNKEAAFALGISVRTIKAHRQRISEKLGAKSIADLVSFAERLGLMNEREVADGISDPGTSLTSKSPPGSDVV